MDEDEADDDFEDMSSGEEAGVVEVKKEKKEKKAKKAKK